MADDTLSFAVLGDCKSQVSLVEPEPFRQIVRSINLLMPDFVVILGDFVKGDTHEDLLEEAWDEFERVARTLKMPYYLVVGNHDVQCRGGEKVFRERFGPLYYSFDYGNSHFVVLNSEDEGADISEGQMDWLREDLRASSDAEHIFVFVHRPLWESEGKGWNGKVHPLLAEHKVKLVFAGHSHKYKPPVVRDGVKYIVTGGGGSVPMGNIEDEGTFYHWVRVTVRGKDFHLAVIRPEGISSEEGGTLPGWRELDLIRKRSFGPAFVAPSKEVPFSEEISITIRNPLRSQVFGRMEWYLPDGWRISPERTKYSIGPRAEVEVRFRVEADLRAKLSYPLPWYEATFGWKEGGEPIVTGRSGMRLRRRFICRRVEGRITIDGNLDKWEGLEPLRLDRKEQVVGPWKGPSDLSAEIFLAWDEDHLYLAAKVKDDRFCQEFSGADSWQGDSVQISFDTSNDDSSELDEGDYEYALALTPKGPEAFRLSVEEGRMRGEEVDVPLFIEVLPEEGLHIYEVAIPWSQLKPFRPEEGRICGFNVVVNDNDGEGPKGWIAWTPGIRESKDTSFFGDLVFE